MFVYFILYSIIFDLHIQVQTNHAINGGVLPENEEGDGDQSREEGDGEGNGNGGEGDGDGDGEDIKGARPRIR